MCSGSLKLPFNLAGVKSTSLKFIFQMIVCLGGEGISDVVPFSQLATDNGSKQDDLDSITFDAKNDVVIIPYSSGTTGPIN